MATSFRCQVILELHIILIMSLRSQHMLNIIIITWVVVLSFRNPQGGQKASLVPPELQNKHHVRSLFLAKKSISRGKKSKLLCMGASPFFTILIIRQISHYLLD